MPNPVLVWFDDTGTNPVTTLSFTGLVPGTPSAWQTVRLYNDEDGAAGSDPAIGRKVRALARTSVLDEFVASGHPLVDSRGVEFQILGGTATDVVPSGIVTLGAMATFPLVPIQSTKYVEARVRATLPPGSGLTDAEVSLALDPAPTASLGDVGALATRGVDWGIGRRSFSEILAEFTIEPSGSPDEFVTFGDLVAVVQGRPVVTLGDDFEFTNLDGSAAALASGEAYFGLVSAGPAGTTVTKGNKATAPLDSDDEPALPAGHKRLGRVTVPFGLVIDAADIQVDASPVGFSYLGATGRQVSLSGGRAAVGTQLAVPAGSQNITITASSTETAYVLGDGSLTTAPGASVDALPLWTFTADGSSIVGAPLDRRSWAHQGSERGISLVIGSGALNAAAYFLVPADGPGLCLHPVLGVRATLIDSDPSALGASSGSWVLEVEYRLPGGSSFTSLFPGSGSDDRRPTLLESVTDPEFSLGLPDGPLYIPPGSTVRARLAAVPTGGTPAAGVVISLPGYEVS